MAHLLFLKIKENCQQLSLVNKSHNTNRNKLRPSRTTPINLCTYRNSEKTKGKTCKWGKKLFVVHTYKRGPALHFISILGMSIIFLNIFTSKYHLKLLEKVICLVVWSEMIRQILNPHICKQQYIAIHNWVSRHTSINWLIYKQRCSMTKWDLGILQKNWIISSYYLEEQGTYIYFFFCQIFQL